MVVGKTKTKTKKYCKTKTKLKRKNNWKTKTKTINQNENHTEYNTVDGDTSGGVNNFHLRAVAHGVWGMEIPSGVQGQSPPVGGMRETKSPEAEAVCRHCLQIWTAETIKI